ncbi:hypothetical protein PPN31114_02829 [Pandoraea pneumonica]|uniref:Uncharacterized protein n=1 Tax=Pandoraea pneumonica TaxID=2508299 RepID=A0A5E4VU21_9BURK|nr:hypothetical protein [Pandoraea pneumonica]VVE14560.1 hypothetical protein PPN31114_02829 [Pandoraea pneumonica]
MCLESAGVNIKNIDIYVDGSDRVSIDNFIRSGTASPVTVKQSKDFFIDQKNNTHENLVMFVTGHGGLEGLDANPPITPHGLLNSIKSSPNLKRAVVYLGQCYAGIFNYIGAGSKTLANGEIDPEVILIGATNLHESLSHSTSETLISGPQSWPANLFLLFAFKWFLNPVDVDGDGKYTIIDSYKFAGVISNASNKQLKALAFPKTHDLQKKWAAANDAHNHDASPTTLAQLEAASTLYKKHLEILYVHQECWILNAIPSQRIER